MIYSTEGIGSRGFMPMIVVAQNVSIRLSHANLREWHEMSPEQRQAIKDAPPDAPWPFQTPCPLSELDDDHPHRRQIRTNSTQERERVARTRKTLECWRNACAAFPDQPAQQTDEYRTLLINAGLHDVVEQYQKFHYWSTP